MRIVVLLAMPRAPYSQWRERCCRTYVLILRQDGGGVKGLDTGPVCLALAKLYVCNRRGLAQPGYRTGMGYRMRTPVDSTTHALTPFNRVGREPPEISTRENTPNLGWGQ